MGLPSLARKYPEIFWSILDRLRENPTEPVVLQFSTRAAARKFQRQFTGFKNACAKEGYNAPRSYILSDTPNDPKTIDPEYPDLNCYVTEMTQKTENLFVVNALHHDYTDMALSVKASLAQRPDFQSCAKDDLDRPAYPPSKTNS